MFPSVNSKKIQKIETPLWRLFKPKQVGKGQEREKIEIIVTINSYPTHNIEFQKKKKKESKNQKIPLWLHSKPKQVGKGRGMRK